MKIHLRTWNLALVVFATSIGILLASAWSSTGRDHSKSKPSVYAALGNVPQKALTVPNPLENDADAVAAGAKLYQEHCADCHGLKAEGKKGVYAGPSLIGEPVQKAASGTLFWILTNGVVRHGMPDWSKLPETERWQIVTFLKSFKGSAAPPSAAAPQ